MLDRENIKINQAKIDAIGDQECVAITIVELAVRPHQIITQIIHRGSYQSCKEALDASEGPIGWGSAETIKNAYGSVTATKDWDAKVAEAQESKPFPVVLPGNSAMVN